MRIGVLGHHNGLARRLAGAGVEVVLHPGPVGGGSCHAVEGVRGVDSYEALAAGLEHPRLFMLDLPLGETIDRAIDTAYVAMEPGDIVLDPSGSYWGDTLRRFRRMRHRSLFYLDLAFLGEIPHGTVLVAGDARGIALASPLLQRLAPAGNLVRAGAAGAAHYALMVRETVATCVAHALSEGRQLLEAYPNEPEAEALARRLWPQAETPGPRAGWLLDDAVRLEAAVPLLAQAIMLEIGTALDERRSSPPPPRVNGFVHPDNIL